MTHSVTILACLLGLSVAGAWAAEARNKHYPCNRSPLVQEKFVPLPLGAVKPDGANCDFAIVRK